MNLVHLLGDTYRPLTQITMGSPVSTTEESAGDKAIPGPDDLDALGTRRLFSAMWHDTTNRLQTYAPLECLVTVI